MVGIGIVIVVIVVIIIVVIIIVIIAVIIVVIVVVIIIVMFNMSSDMFGLLRFVFMTGSEGGEVWSLAFRVYGFQGFRV